MRSLVVDASAIVAVLVGDEQHAADVATCLVGRGLAAPYLLDAEVSNVLRRHVARGGLSPEAGTVALAEFQDLWIERHAFAPFAGRVWQLRDNMSAYDAWYVALAEELDAPLLTLDDRLRRAPGTRCAFAAV